MARHAILTPQRFSEMLEMHCWLGEPKRAAMRKAIVEDLFIAAPDGLVFPTPFQMTLAKHVGLPEMQAFYVYDSVYRMVYEMLLGRVLPKKGTVCFNDDGEDIPLKRLERPADFSD